MRYVEAQPCAAVDNVIAHDIQFGLLVGFAVGHCYAGQNLQTRQALFTGFTAYASGLKLCKLIGRSLNVDDDVDIYEVVITEAGSRVRPIAPDIRDDARGVSRLLEGLDRSTIRQPLLLSRLGCADYSAPAGT